MASFIEDLTRSRTLLARSWCQYKQHQDPGGDPPHPAPPPASEFLDFLIGTIFVFPSVQLPFPGGHALDHLQELEPL